MAAPTTSRQRSASIESRAQDTRRCARGEDVARASERVGGRHDDATNAPGHRVGAAGIDVGHADDGTLIRQQAAPATEPT